MTAKTSEKRIVGIKDDTKIYVGFVLPTSETQEIIEKLESLCEGKDSFEVYNLEFYGQLTPYAVHADEDIQELKELILGVETLEEIPLYKKDNRRLCYFFNPEP